MLRVLVAAFTVIALLAPGLPGGETKPGDAKLRVAADIPGGNIIVDKIEGDQVHVHQDLRDTAGDWFYWHFRVEGGQGRTHTFHFTKSNPIGVRGPAVSDDAGKTWRWLGPQAVRGASFHYAFPATGTDVRFCFAFPYQANDLQAFIKRFEKSPHFKAETLCQTKKGRAVELLHVGRLDGKCQHRVAFTCRHHSCEMMASYVLEGIVEEALSDSATGQWLREQVAFFIVPMVDKDGVEDGDQGKNRKPRDHNRDYEGKSIYSSVEAIRKRLPEWSAGKLRLAMDLHCPWIRGGINETLYFVGGPDEKVWQESVRFSKVLEKEQHGPLLFHSKNNLPFGQGWNTQANYKTGMAFARWVAEIPGVRVATTLETAYASADGRPVTDASARALGRDLARALKEYLGIVRD